MVLVSCVEVFLLYCPPFDWLIPWSWRWCMYISETPPNRHPELQTPALYLTLTYVWTEPPFVTGSEKRGNFTQNANFYHCSTTSQIQCWKLQHASCLEQWATKVHEAKYGGAGMSCLAFIILLGYFLSGSKESSGVPPPKKNETPILHTVADPNGIQRKD